MKIIRQENQPSQDERDIAAGYFNGGEHLFVQIEPGAYQTISARLPNGKFVTFAFVARNSTSEDILCVDLHTTVGKPYPRKDGNKGDLYPIHLVGFCTGTNSFDTRKIDRRTNLATVLLSDEYYKGGRQ